MTWEALWRRVQFGKEVLGNGLALAVPVEDNPHGSASMVFFLDCRHKFLRVGVLHAFAHVAVRAQEVNPSYGSGASGDSPVSGSSVSATGAAFSAT